MERSQECEGVILERGAKKLFGVILVLVILERGAKKLFGVILVLVIRECGAKKLFGSEQKILP